MQMAVLENTFTFNTCHFYVQIIKWAILKPTEIFPL